MNITKDLVAEKVENVCDGLEREISEADYEKFECSISFCGTDLCNTGQAAEIFYLIIATIALLGLSTE